MSIESEDVELEVEVSEEDLAAFNNLVQDGLILRDRVKAGIAQARQEGRPHGRPRCAGLRDMVRARCAPELLDFKAHSEKFEDMRWLVEHPPLQTTWKQLIRMALGYEGAPSDTEDVRRYQRDRLGRSDSDTLLIFG